MAESLILIEHDRQQVKRPSLHADHAGATTRRRVRAARARPRLGRDRHISCFLRRVCSDCGRRPGLGRTVGRPLRGSDRGSSAKAWREDLLGTSSTFSKDVLPRAAALLDAPMITDVVAIEEMNGSIAYRRPINAGSMFATVKVEGDRRVLTARATAFDAPAADAAPCPIERFDFDAASLPNGMQFISREERKSDRPDLTEARVVVCWRPAAEGPGNIRASGRRIGGCLRRRSRRDPRGSRCRNGA